MSTTTTSSSSSSSFPFTCGRDLMGHRFDYKCMNNEGTEETWTTATVENCLAISSSEIPLLVGKFAAHVGEPESLDFELSFDLVSDYLAPLHTHTPKK